MAASTLVLLLALAAGPLVPTKFCRTYQPSASVSANSPDRRKELTEKVERWARYAFAAEHLENRGAPYCRLSVSIIELPIATAVHVSVSRLEVYAPGRAYQMVFSEDMVLLQGLTDYREREIREFLEKFISGFAHGFPNEPPPPPSQ